MGIIERKEREKQEMKNLILEAASRLFQEQGYEKTSIRNIAERIEYSPATIYLYYKDKDELFYGVHEKGFELLFEEMKPLMNIADPLERLRKMGDTYVRFAFEHPDYYDLMFIVSAPIENLHKHNEEWDCGLQNFCLLRDTVAECLEKQLIKPVEPDIAAMSIFSFVHGMVSLSIRNRFIMFPKEQLPKMFEASMDNMMNLITASP
jgi:AcrR family transcriptional regulator